MNTLRSPRVWTRRVTIFLLAFLVALTATVANASDVTKQKPKTAVPPATQPNRPGNLRAVQPAAAGATSTLQNGITIAGLDLHDGTLQQFGGTWYLYGTEYACGYKWGDATTHWCGFGVASAPDPTGPWSAITTLLKPTDIDPWSGNTWDVQCIRTNGGGCFNPRVVFNPNTQKYLMWFNAVGDNSYDHANAYNVYELSSPTGPVSTYNKPRSYTCAACNGDFSIFIDRNGTTAYLIGTGSNRAEYVEQLDSDWKNGTGNVAGHGSSALFSDAEGPGVYYDANSGFYIMTVSHPECGYCTGVRSIYAISPNPIGPWSAPQGAEASPHGGSVNGPDGARSEVSGNNCGGQPRTIVMINGQPYQFIDLWLGQQNETNANIYLAPLVFHNAADTYGAPLQPFDAFTCASVN